MAKLHGVQIVPKILIALAIMAFFHFQLASFFAAINVQTQLSVGSSNVPIVAKEKLLSTMRVGFIGRAWINSYNFCCHQREQKGKLQNSPMAAPLGRLKVSKQYFGSATD